MPKRLRGLAVVGAVFGAIGMAIKAPDAGWDEQHLLQEVMGYWAVVAGITGAVAWV